MTQEYKVFVFETQKAAWTISGSVFVESIDGDNADLLLYHGVRTDDWETKARNELKPEIDQLEEAIRRNKGVYKKAVDDDETLESIGKLALERTHLKRTLKELKTAEFDTIVTVKIGVPFFLERMRMLYFVGKDPSITPKERLRRKTKKQKLV